MNNLFGNRKPIADPQRQPPPSQQSSGGYYDKPPSASYGQYDSNSYGRQAAPARSGYGDAYAVTSANYHQNQRNSGGGPASTQKERYGYNESSGHGPGQMFKVVEFPNKELDQLSNLVAVSWDDFPKARYPEDKPIYITVDGYTFTAVQVRSIAPRTVGLNSMQRNWVRVSPGYKDDRMVELRPPGAQPLSKINAEVVYARPGKTLVQGDFLDHDEFCDMFTEAYEGQILAPGQPVLTSWHGVSITVNIQTVKIASYAAASKSGDRAPDQHASGMVTKETLMVIDAAPATTVTPRIPLRESERPTATTGLLAENFKFEDLKIGGLREEFAAIFRRAFASRIFPARLIADMGIQHVKGMLLYGPPGTGKTLIARQIAHALKANPPKVINGPEVLNKFVGQSEENIRKLFADAEKEYKEKGDKSMLHIIIFDELDAVCKQRGSGGGGGTGVGDSVVNQLLSKLDGVDQLNNILLIGMTNRKDMIDDALLRPGRLEVHMEISLPDETGRVEILNIHTATMEEKGKLSKDVDLAGIAKRAKNFSGAELAGLVRAASSFALQRHVKVGTTAEVADNVAEMKVTNADFIEAFTEITPAFGASEDMIKACLGRGIIDYSEATRNILASGKLLKRQVLDPRSAPCYRALLWGPPGCGKTALAARIAQQSSGLDIVDGHRGEVEDEGFPYKKVISPDDMIGFSEIMKKDHMRRIFEDAYKSKSSVVIIDNIESIIEWVKVGPRFSNPVLQALKAMLNKQPLEGHSLLVLATATERSVMQELGLYQSFDQKIPVPPVRTGEELEAILERLRVFDSQEQRQDVVRQILDSSPDRAIGVGVKSILLALDTAKQDRDRVGRFVQTVTDMRAENDVY